MQEIRSPVTGEVFELQAYQDGVVKGGSKQLKAGFSVKVNIKLRDRTLLSLLTDMFSKQSDGLKNLR